VPDPNPSLDFWPDRQPRMATVFPAGIAHGGLTVKHVAFTEIDNLHQSLQAMQGRNRGGYNRPGDVHARIYQGGTLWMSDTSEERRDHARMLHRATGDVLVGGLGLGLFALAAMLKPEVKSVTVIEINPDVIALVEKYLRLAAGEHADKLTVICADLLDWKPPKGQTWDVLWFDIWPTLCVDDLAEHTRLRRRFARRRNPGGHTDCWGSAYLKERQRRDRAEERRGGFGWF
jgi:hypothetical protein